MGAPLKFAFGSRSLTLTEPLVMGVINLTPDSFSDGGRYADSEQAIEAALSMIEAGAAIIDLGAESTRPGATAVAAELQLERILPVLEYLNTQSDVVLSIDTGSADVIRGVAAAGADFINDVYALREPGALEALAATDLGVCLMHMQGTPATMQEQPEYKVLPDDIVNWLADRLGACEAAGIARERTLIDPGFGFGKTDAHNLTLLARLADFHTLGRPVLVGWSRKSTLGRLTGREPKERLAAGLAAATLAVNHGAAIIRTHDVPETVDALRIAHAVNNHA